LSHRLAKHGGWLNRLLITGGSSYLGQHLVPRAAPNFELLHTHFRNEPPSLSNAFLLDIRDRDTVWRLVSEWQPDIIIHLAGSNRTPDMEEVIRQGAENITAVSEKCNCKLIHLSTDVVFDGRSGPYNEHDKPNPIHDYGRAKADSESIISRYQNHVIIRTSLIYGLDKIDRSTEWITTSLDNGETITLFEDQIRNPIWVETLCRSCLELATSEFTGIIHIAGSQALSRAEFGIKLLKWWGYDQLERLQIGRSSDHWPKDCRLNIDLASKSLTTPMPGVDTVLKMSPRPDRH
jgi:dTDP-4-dehydrorhamnose reductase